MNKRDQVLGHADEADGIEEYDNPLPGWWLGILYGSILFAFAYTADRYYFRPTNQAQEYDEETAAGPKPASADAVITPEAVEAGKLVYTANCVACHGVDLHGGIGADLTDDVWIHGGKLDNIVTTITAGVPDKGMPTWGPILGPQKVAQVAAFVHEQGGGQ